MKNTKKALFMSVLSMMLCITMLIGSTFAWFTDTVTTGKNKIVAGNLDVELYHSKTADFDEEDGRVEGATDLFTDKDGEPINWEPGVVAYENFKIENKGSLALKYQFKLEAAGFNTVKVGEESKSLADILMVAVVDEKITDRADVDNIAADKFVPFKDFVFDNSENSILVSSAEAAKEDAVLSNAEEFTVVIYWQPSDNDNDYNLNNGKKSSNGEPLYIDLGITLVATQATYESDSFDKNYDSEADYPNIPAVINSTITGPVNDSDDTVLTNPEKTVTVTIPADALKDEVTDVVLNIKTAERSDSSVTYDIKLVDSKGEPAINDSGEKITVELKVGKGLMNVRVNHNDEPMDQADYYYNSTTGVVTIKTSSFSPFKIMFDQLNDENALSYPVYPDGVTTGSFTDNKVAVTSDGVYIENTKDALRDAINAGGTLYFKEGATLALMAAHVNVTKDLTIYANGADFGGKDISIGTYAAPENGEATVNIYNARNLTVWGQPVAGRADIWNVNLYDCTNDGYGFVMYRGSDTATAKINLTMKNCKATGYSDSLIHTTADGTIKITDCAFADNCAPVNIAHKQSGTMAVTVENSIFNNCGKINPDDDYFAPVRFVNNSSTGTLTIALKNNTFTDTIGTNGDILLGDYRPGKSSQALTAEITTKTPVMVKSSDEEPYSYAGGTIRIVSITANDDGTYSDGENTYVKVDDKYVKVVADETTEGLYIAENGDTYAATSEAITAALKLEDNAGGKIANITVLVDIEKEFKNTTLEYGGVTYPIDNKDPFLNVTTNSNANIDFDDKIVTINSESGQNGIKVEKDATLTLSNGTIEQNKSYGTSKAVVYTDKGTVVLIDMTVENIDKKGVTVSAGSDGGVLEIYGSTIVGGEKYNDAVFCGSQSEIWIEGSTVIGCIRAANNGKIEINGGDYTQATFESDYKHHIIIYNGLFNFDPSTSTEVILADPDNTYVTDNGDGTWSVATLDAGDFDDPFGE